MVYNFRDQIWYDSNGVSGIARNSWQDKDVFNSPIAIDPGDNTIYMHESTAANQAETGFAESGAVDIGFPRSGERFSRVSKIYSDTEQLQTGNVNFQFFTAHDAESTETASAVLPVEADGVIDTRLQGRQLRLKVSGTLLNDWTVGNTRLELHPGGRR